MKQITYLTIVIPTYNEERSIRAALNQLGEYVGVWNLEVIVSDDGSEDETVKRILDFSAENSWVRVITSERNRGRGEAVSSGFREASGDILIFIDADMATDISHLKEMVHQIENSYDICIGSRWLSGSLVERTIFRLMISRIYNFIVRIIFRSPISDHQCGFKGFKREVALSLVKESGIREDRGWFWDTEMLIRGLANGYSIKEIPVKWEAGKESKFDWRRDITMGLLYLIKLKRRLLEVNHGRT